MKKFFVFILVMCCCTSFITGCSKDQKQERPPAEEARLGVMVGSTNEMYAESNYPDADIERFNNYVDSSAALLGNKLDYAMMDYTSALNFVRYNKELEIVSDFLTDEKLCLGINQNKPELAEQFSDIVDQYLTDGTMDEIISHWIKEDGSDYTVVDTPKLENAPVLKAAIITSREPTTFMLDNAYAGMDIELIERIAFELGYRVEYLDMELSGLITAMGSNKADICMGIYKTPEREQQLLFTSPYFTNPQVMIAKK